ncbi:thioredoxin family protein [Tessaracoccus sp. MC1627]|uniref:thioredoxin family protein n=1 Tax=Tessaracoccus sp. MC1627 TaxID=2760312 RepID=UPI0015FF27E4|nr:thioredoxin family protein [Tessaracoccus sp. MC1627]
MTLGYSTTQPTRAEIDQMDGLTVLQFGTNWCGYCRAAERVIELILAAVPQVRRIKAEDGRGRPLGRSYHVKLWPTLIFLRDGKEVARVVRPESRQAVQSAVDELTGGRT